ncbi:FAD-dependent oxidoreductase [Alkalibacter rhizosphaerae]|uniref:FAD-dependent oxidoreductase n=1 Tax=Alkalibacter rhizosphaerae TaxID=2815577 RepID=A0A974XI15_9FIRM|nr:FAD-dependent oxidoreductase [Alkalibacter rhizosphaerae]
MSLLKYPNLYSPIVLGNTLFKNRIFASPTGYQNLNGDGYLNEGATAYYERKARGGAASVATFEGVVDGELGKGGATHICLDTPQIDRGLSRIAQAVKSYGSVASLELQHTGMFANRDLAMFGGSSKGLAYGPVEMELNGRNILPMTEDILERTIEKYAKGAALAKRCGFGMVTVHAGHGWLLHQFLSPITNTRTDKWGGSSVENRTRLVKSICQAIRKEVGAAFPIEIRISGSECYEGGYDLDEGIAIATQLDGYVDLIHVSAGNHEVAEVFAVTHPSMFMPDGCNVQYAAEIKKHVKTPVATIGALSDPALMEEIIASGKADVVQMARQLLSDPDFPNKVRTGREDQVKKCMRCLSCFTNELTVGEPYCAINPETGRELEMKFAVPSAISKDVLIIGGGVGGMEAAITCADRGHQVTLVEKSNRLGGVLRCEDGVSFKKNLDAYLDGQERRIHDHPNIRLMTGLEMEPETAKRMKPDVIIAALGAKAVIPQLPGMEKQNVWTAQDAYVSMDKLGDKIIILGAGLVGVELGLHLLENNKTVTLVEMADRVNDGGNFLHMLGLQAELDRTKLPILFNTTVKEITDIGVRCISIEKEMHLQADTVIFAVGQHPLRDQGIAFHDCAPEFHMLGDCVQPRNITAATSEAFMISRNIGLA